MNPVVTSGFRILQVSVRVSIRQETLTDNIVKLYIEINIYWSKGNKIWWYFLPYHWDWGAVWGELCSPHKVTLFLHPDLKKPLGAPILKLQQINCESFVFMLNVGEWRGRWRVGAEKCQNQNRRDLKILLWGFNTLFVPKRLFTFCILSCELDHTSCKKRKGSLERRCLHVCIVLASSSVLRLRMSEWKGEQARASLSRALQ